jgi:hypothetical protein
MKFGNLNFLEPSGPLQACDGTALPLLLPLPLPLPLPILYMFEQIIVHYQVVSSVFYHATMVRLAANRM